MDAQSAGRKSLLKKKRGIISSVASQHSVSKGHVSRVAAGERRSPIIERAIARALRLPLREVFPEWYGEGEPQGGESVA
jgi:Winged helix-turn-helix DNA-binding